MAKQVAAVDPNGHDAIDFSAVESGDSPAPERPAAKFLYPGGSRPLEGYTIKRGIGHGGFGEIYYAVSDAGKEVALKLIRRNLEVELRGVRHCLNLKHPNLLALYDIRQDDEGDTWVVMEYVSGDCLEDALADHSDGLPVEQALGWFHGIAAGVAYLHDRGIVHRDLKPGNVFSEEGVVKVGDYGLSKFISCSRRSGQTESVGTVHYMAPEVANGRYGKEIDIYALGIMLYEMLTGRVPFEGESVGEVLMKHLTAKPDVSLLAEPYRGVVARALEKDPAQRFQSVQEMLAALPQPAEVPPGAGRLPSGSYATAKAVGTEPTDEEPILRAVRDAWSSLCTTWQQSNLHTGAKFVLLLVGMFLLVDNAGVLIPLAVGLLILYGGYRLVRMLVLSGSRAAGHTSAHRAAAIAPPAPQAAAGPLYGPAYARSRPWRRKWHDSREQPAAALLVKSRKERLTELVGSMLAGSLVAMAMCIVMVLLMSYRGTTPRPEQCAWLVLVSIAGTWAVLVPSKFWEGTRGEPMLRRFILMVVGLGLGAVAFGTATMLLVSLPPGAGFPKPPNYQLPPSFYAGDGRPLAMAYLACFGTLFLVIRWWRQADPLRSSRLSLWSLLISVVLAGIVAGVWHFPQPWLVMVAGVISVSVQLASPWMSPQKRARPQNV